MEIVKGWFPHQHDAWPARYGDLREDKMFRKWNGHGANPEFTDYLVKTGTTVKIVMVSRFGDVGITTNLNAEYGYDARVTLDQLTNLRMEAENV